MNMKRAFFLVTTLLICFLTNAQTSRRTDSLLLILKTSLHDTARVNTYTNLASEFLKTDLSKGISFGDSAILLSNKISFYKGIIAGYRLKGVAFAYQGDNRMACEFFKQTLSLSLIHGIKKEIAK